MPKVGALSLPRVAELVGDELRLAPALEVDALRTEAAPQGRATVTGGDQVVQLGPPSRHFELQATIRATLGTAGSRSAWHPTVRKWCGCSSTRTDGGWSLTVPWPAAIHMRRQVGPRLGSLIRVARGACGPSWTAPCLLEVCVSEQLALTSRIYPTWGRVATRAFFPRAATPESMGSCGRSRPQPSPPHPDTDAC